MSNARRDVTALLEAASAGEREAFDEAYHQVYDELRRLAHVVRRRRPAQTMSTTALVHEAYLKLLPSQGLDWAGRTHFLRVAVRAMRQLMIDAAERRMALKRGGGQPVITFDEALHHPVGPEDVLALDMALQRLEDMDPRQAQVVEYRFFAGLSVEETARALDVSTPTVKRDWRAARAWLAYQLGQNVSEP